jgi:hypothetical protein
MTSLIAPTFALISILTLSSLVCSARAAVGAYVRIARQLYCARKGALEE